MYQQSRIKRKQGRSSMRIGPISHNAVCYVRVYGRVGGVPVCVLCSAQPPQHKL